MYSPSTTSNPAGSHLRIDGISKSYPDRRVLTDISFHVNAGERVALIGENGTGKSTLLRIIAGLETPDSGTISAPGAIGLHHQQAPFPLNLTAQQVLDDAARPLHELTRAVEIAGEHLAENPSAADELDAALTAAERADAWNVEHTIDILVDGLGIGSIKRDTPMNEVSGGQLARFSLAWMLIRRPQTLLLDEPTNHLDDRGAQMLTSMLATWPGPVLLASHDRAFLDETVTDLIDLDPRPLPHSTTASLNDAADAGAAHGVTRFTGSYSDYVIARRDEYARWMKQYDDEQAELKRLRAKVKTDHTVGHTNWKPRSDTRMAQKFYGDRNASVVSRRVNDTRTTLERLEEEQVRKPPKALRFNASTLAAGPSVQGSDAVLVATNVSVTDRLKPVSVSLSAGERLLIEGPNGCGKSTLLKVLAGQLEPDAGNVQRPARIRIGMLGQDTAIPDADASVADVYRSRVGDELAEKRPLATFGLIAGRDENRPVSALSVGQRRRLDLACLLASPPDILLLDEPTNHFSLLLAEDIERALLDYPGALIVASHDRMLRSRWAGRRLVMNS